MTFVASIFRAAIDSLYSPGSPKEDYMYPPAVHLGLPSASMQYCTKKLRSVDLCPDYLLKTAFIHAAPFEKFSYHSTVHHSRFL